MNRRYVLVELARQPTRIALTLMDLFVGLTAIGGGTALLTHAIDLPTRWLQTTPFLNYDVPGLILTLVVGGSATVAGFAMPRDKSLGAVASVVAGIILAGWIIGEVALLGLSQWLQPFYFVLGLLMVTFGLDLRAENSTH